MTNTIVLLPDTGMPELVQLEGPEDRDAQLSGLMACQPIDVVSLTERPGGLDMWVCDPTRNVHAYKPLMGVREAYCVCGKHFVSEQALHRHLRDERKTVPNLIATAVAGRYETTGTAFFGSVVFASTVLDEDAGELRMCGLSEEQLNELIASIELFRHTYGYYPWKVDR